MKSIFRNYLKHLNFKVFISILLSFCAGVTTVRATSQGQAYLERFKTFQYWSTHLPSRPDNSFLAFIAEDKPLAKKLRERWLYLMASQKDWSNFKRHYRVSNDTTLQCFYHRAEYLEGDTTKALKAALSVWQSPESSPKACEPLLNLLIHSDFFTDKIITERLVMALDKSHISLARYLLHLYKTARREDAKLLSSVHQNPTVIRQLKPGFLHDIFYLYGLKRMVTTKFSEAVKQWQNPLTKQMLSLPQQQDFIAHMTLYLASQKSDEADIWFNKLTPEYYNDALLQWKARKALHHHDWALLSRLIPYMTDAKTPCWQYWLARALEKSNSKEATETARKIYEQLAETRQYYGFLASIRLHKPLRFNQEYSQNNPHVLLAYKPFLDEIKNLYTHKQNLQASRLLNDFVLELPKEDKSALLHWLATELQWHGKSVHLSEDATLANQLSLRFPLPYDKTLQGLAKYHQVPLELVYAIMRQESGFREDVVSLAGARGLMQLMPATARVIASHEKIAYNNKDQLFLPHKNIAIGAAYLRHLSARFSSNIIFMAAAYNAGPGQVHSWIKDKMPREMDIWIETIPWRETRNYLKNVLAFYAVYQHRMQHKSDLNLSLNLS